MIYSWFWCESLIIDAQEYLPEKYKFLPCLLKNIFYLAGAKYLFPNILNIPFSSIWIFKRSNVVKYSFTWWSYLKILRNMRKVLSMWKLQTSKLSWKFQKCFEFAPQSSLQSLWVPAFCKMRPNFEGKKDIS